MADSSIPPHTSPGAQPTAPIPPLAVPPTLPARTDRRLDLSVALASLWLACSVIAGLWLMASSHDIAGEDIRMDIPAGTSYESYGGDAYTGIQNASADSANALKAIAEFENANARTGRRVTERANMGIGFLIMSIGVVNFTMALRRKPTSTS